MSGRKAMRVVEPLPTARGLQVIAIAAHRHRHPHRNLQEPRLDLM